MHLKCNAGSKIPVLYRIFVSWTHRWPLFNIMSEVLTSRCITTLWEHNFFLSLSVSFNWYRLFSRHPFFFFFSLYKLTFFPELPSWILQNLTFDLKYLLHGPAKGDIYTPNWKTVFNHSFYSGICAGSCIFIIWGNTATIKLLKWSKYRKLMQRRKNLCNMDRIVKSLFYVIDPASAAFQVLGMNLVFVWYWGIQPKALHMLS